MNKFSTAASDETQHFSYNQRITAFLTWTMGNI